MKQFSRAASNYHHEALIQKECARKLVEFFVQQKITLGNGPCLEIGCGTGFVTELILPLVPNHHWNITDISPQMVSECQKQIGKKSLTFNCLNGEEIDEKSQYALIISGMTFQWFQNFDKSLNKLRRALMPGGFLCFSFLTASSFPEWRQVCEEIDVPFTGHPLPNSILEAQTYQEERVATYPSANHFFRHLKRIGAGTALEKPLTPHSMRRLLHHWNASSPITVTYSVLYALIKN